MELILIFAALIIASGISLLLKDRKAIEFLSASAAAFAAAESLVVALAVSARGEYRAFSLFSVDSFGAVVMLVVAFTGLASAAYSIPCLRRESAKGIIGFTRVKQYYVLFNLFLAALFVVVAASSPIFAWIAIEATTLSTAFLVSFYNKPSSVEAAWKYVIINSVGLLLGFLGTLLYFSSTAVIGRTSWYSLAYNAARLDPLIIKMAFIFVLIGYGTKVGFAPMHTWKPDAYSKAPAPLGAMLSGAVMPAAFLVLMKFKKITDLALGPAFAQNLLIAFGLVSIVIAAVTMLTSRNYKRLLAYSSIENAGVAALGFGFGGAGAFAAILHLIYHSLVKSVLFFSAGNLVLKYSSAKIANVRGALKAMPVTASLFIAGFLIVTGLPPFGMFLTKLMVLSAGITARPAAAVAALAFMTVVFVGFLKQVTAMVYGQPADGITSGEGSAWLVVPPIAVLALIACLSFYLPPFLHKLIAVSVLRY